MNPIPAVPAPIDVCIVATRRPELLALTLASFQQNLFRHFRIRRLIANIDPAFGTEADQRECIRLIRSYDPDALITTPAEANFAAAVARVWAASTTDIILHLEDDWLLKRALLPADVKPMAEDESIGEISLNHAGKAWSVERKGPFVYTRRPRRFLGVSLPWRRRIPLFLTAPAFFRGSFARAAASLMDPAFDPEKQFCRGVNPALEAYVLPFRNMILGGATDYYIEDLGRRWREDRQIGKRLVGGQSHWDWVPHEADALPIVPAVPLVGIEAKVEGIRP
jgi:hypothetical protein